MSSEKLGNFPELLRTRNEKQDEKLFPVYGGNTNELCKRKAMSDST